MQVISMERVRQLDAACEKEVRNILCQGYSRPQILNPRSVFGLSETAEKFKIPLQEFCSYIWLQMYIAELSESFDDFPSPKVMAQQFGIDSAEFESYLHRRAGEIADIRIKDDPLRKATLLSDPWDSEQNELDDLQSDAGLQGD